MKVMMYIFLKLMFNIPKLYITYTMNYPFCIKKENQKSEKKHVANLQDKTEYVIHIRN